MYDVIEISLQAILDKLNIPPRKEDVIHLDVVEGHHPLQRSDGKAVHTAAVQ